RGPEEQRSHRPQLDDQDHLLQPRRHPQQLGGEVHDQQCWGGAQGRRAARGAVVAIASITCWKANGGFGRSGRETSRPSSVAAAKGVSITDGAQPGAASCPAKPPIWKRPRRSRSTQARTISPETTRWSQYARA